MAEYFLIDRYLSELDRHVGRLKRAEEVIAEVADHLLEAVTVNMARGLDRGAAQRRALEEFGDPELVGRALASVQRGGIAVPTHFTKRAGILLVISSVLWLLSMAGQFWSDVLDSDRAWEGSPQTVYTLSATALFAAGVLLVIGIAALNQRHGGGLGTPGRLAFWGAIPTAFLAQGPWAWGLWLTGLGLVAALLSLALVRSGMAPRTPSLLIGVGGVGAAVSVWSVHLSGRTIDLGSGLATLLAAIGIAIFSAGIALLGIWLYGERPATEQDHLATA